MMSLSLEDIIWWSSGRQASSEQFTVNSVRYLGISLTCDQFGINMFRDFLNYVCRVELQNHVRDIDTQWLPVTEGLGAFSSLGPTSFFI